MATLKTCFKCSTEKPLTEFYRHAQMGDGHLNKCKECTKRDVREHRAANDSVREYDRKRARDPKRVALAKRVTVRWLAKFPNRRRAHVLLGNAIASGLVQREPCWVCGNPRTEGHHAHYGLPLHVTWLCRRHHAQLHAEHAKYAEAV